MARKRKSNRRRRRKRQKTNPIGTVAVIRKAHIPLFPLRKWVRMYYYETLGLITGALGVAGSFTYSANGAYDPDVTGIGHQPIGFDQMMAVYEHFFITKCRMVVTFNNTKGTPCSVGIYATPDGVNISSPEQLVENGLVVMTTLNPMGEFGCIKTLNYSIDVAKINGRRSVLGENDYRGSAAANPVEQTYFNVCVWSPFAAVNAEAQYTMELVYDVWFTEPRKLTTS